MKKILTIAIPVFLISAITVGYISLRDKPISKVSLSKTLTEKLLPSPTPLPFNELTIPYLRSLTYDGKLADRAFVTNGSNYSQYLTSYQSEGNTINALMTVPEGTPPAGGWPAVVFIHGYVPPAQYQTLTRYSDFTDYISRAGFVVLKIDLRGHGESEGRPSGAYYSNGYVIDTLNAYNALQSAPDINKNKVGLWGHSMAGNIVLRALAAKPAIPAAVIWAGAGYTYQDLIDYKINDTSYVPQPSQAAGQSRQRIMQVVGPVSATSPFWQAMAPSHFLNDMKGALQINHAVDDDVVSVEYSRNLKKLLDKTSMKHEIIEYPSGGHNIIGESFVPAMNNTVRFYNENLTDK